MVVFPSDAIKPALLGATRRRRGPRGRCFQDRMELFVRSVLLGMTRDDAHGRDAQPDPPDAQTRQPRPCRAAKGGPLSLRMRSGNPESAKARSKQRRVAS